MSPSRADRTVDLLSVLCFGLAALTVVAAIVATLAGTEDGLLIAPFLGVPMVLLGLGLREGGRARAVAGVAGLLLAVLLVVTTAGNWSGFDGRGRVLAPLAIAPFVVAGLAIFAVTAPGARPAGGRRGVLSKGGPRR